VKIELDDKETEVVRTAIMERWSREMEQVRLYRDMLAGRETIPQGVTRERISMTFDRCEETGVMLHNLLNKLEKNHKVSQFGPGSKVVITAPQDTYEGQHAVVKQSILTDKGDFVHLVRIGDQNNPTAPETMYEEKNLQELK
jgi:hypothetical protein